MSEFMRGAAIGFLFGAASTAVAMAGLYLLYLGLELLIGLISGGLVSG